MDIDKLIRNAMDDEDKAWFDSLGEPSLPMQVIESFKTQSKWIILWSIPVVFVMLGFFVLSVVRILGTDDPALVTRWSMLAVVLFFAIGMIKIWYWMEIQKYALVRELKRLEMQVTRLSQRLDEKQGGE